MTDLAKIDEGYYHPDLFTEDLKLISNSKRIFILTNKKNNLIPGDFISLLLNNELVARGMVGKIKDELAGVKIIKIYSVSRWSQIRRNFPIQILRGDDSYYLRKIPEPTKEVAQEDLPEIKDTEDLYNDKGITEFDWNDKGGVVEDEAKGEFVNDHIVSFSYGLYRERDLNDSLMTYTHWNGSWAYQLLPNVFVEGLFGYSRMESFPAVDLATSIYNLTFRAKYSFKLPLYMYLMPYIGYQNIMASSKDAGTCIEDEATCSSSTTQQQLAQEEALVEDVGQDSFIFGVTLLRRMVPGWFFKVDVGSDLMAFGLALEF